MEVNSKKFHFVLKIPAIGKRLLLRSQPLNLPPPPTYLSIGADQPDLPCLIFVIGLRQAWAQLRYIYLTGPWGYVFRQKI